MANAIGDAEGINLNEAGVDQLEVVGSIGRERARRIVGARPFRSWEDLKRVDGFDEKRVDDLRGSGATLGDQGNA